MPFTILFDDKNKTRQAHTCPSLPRVTNSFGYIYKMPSLSPPPLSLVEVMIWWIYGILNYACACHQNHPANGTFSFVWTIPHSHHKILWWCILQYISCPCPPRYIDFLARILDQVLLFFSSLSPSCRRIFSCYRVVRNMVFISCAM
jgi:hypothetical protein